MAHLTARRIKTAYLFIYVAACVLSRSVVDAGDCYREDDKSSYTGTINVTRSGRTCQPWESQTPHTHTRGSDPSAFVDGRFPDNFCRTPEDGISVKPWCYTTDADKRWQHCDVPSCDVAELRTEIDARIADMEQTIQQMESGMVASDSGNLRCGQASEWTDGAAVLNGVYYPHTKRITVNFPQPYATPPTVFLSDVSRYISNTDGGRKAVYGTGVLEVTTTGFTMACGSYTTSSDDSRYSYVFELRVNWLSASA